MKTYRRMFGCCIMTSHIEENLRFSSRSPRFSSKNADIIKSRIVGPPVAPPQEGADGGTAGGIVLNIFDIPSYIYIYIRGDNLREKIS